MDLGHELAESSKARVPGSFDSQAGRSLGKVKKAESSRVQREVGRRREGGGGEHESQNGRLDE